MLFKRFASTASATPSTTQYNRLSSGFYKGMGIFWAGVAAFMAQDRYFTRPDQDGNPRLHPITRWILFYRITEEEKLEEMRKLLVDARQTAEVNAFYKLESKRPVKDPRYDPRILYQKDWGYAPYAQDVDHVADLDKVKWNRGYGEDSPSSSDSPTEK